MSKNNSFHRAKKVKNDEFYTLYHDVEREMQAYLEYDENVFKGKVVLLPCDDPGESSFVKYFVANFERLGLNKMVSTCYNPDGKGKMMTVENTVVNGQETVSTVIRDLEGDGDFRSKEVTKMASKVNIVVTNPPFSLFKEFIQWLVGLNVQFSVVGSLGATIYTKIFPLIKNNQMWLGKGFANSTAFFETPGDTGLTKFGNITWYTNIMHGRVNEPLGLMTMEDNLRYNSRVVKNRETKNTVYRKYDNYDAMEVSYTDAIPSDYDGVMGVPVSFISKYNPKQFDIVGIDFQVANGELDSLAKKTWDGKLDKAYIDNKRLYAKIFIQHKQK